MKKIIILLSFSGLLILPLVSQTISMESYTLDNGIVIKMERDWTHEWVQQSQSPVSGTETNAVAVNVRPMGDLTQGTVLKLTSGGKDVRIKDASPGTYDLIITSKLSGKPGTLIYSVKGIVVKPKMKTTVNVTIYNYQINIEETPGTNGGLAYFESKIIRYKGNPDPNAKLAVPAFYVKGLHDAKIAPAEQTGSNSCKIKPATYDLLVTMDYPGYPQKIWLENFALKPDINYKISLNLNAGEISYGGVVREVKTFRMYPVGTADRQKGTAKPDKNIEIIAYDNPMLYSVCPPGTYDVLLGIGSGMKYEWRKGIIVRSGMKTQVK